MTKRGKIILGTPLTFRISKPTFNVDTATAAQLLVSETIFYSQILQSGSVNNPGSGASYTANIAINPGITNPIAVLFELYGSTLCYPAPFAYVTGLASYVPLNAYWFISGGNLVINFNGPYINSIDYNILRVDIP